MLKDFAAVKKGSRMFHLRYAEVVRVPSVYRLRRPEY
jgi:hypothetical protein